MVDFLLPMRCTAPVVMRLRSVEMTLDDVAQKYWQTMHDCPSVQKWIAKGYAEDEVLAEDEIDWTGELIPR